MSLFLRKLLTSLLRLAIAIVFTFFYLFISFSFLFLPIKSVSALPEIATPMEQIPSVSQMSDVKQTDWTFQTLKSLIQNYPIVNDDRQAFPQEIRTFQENPTLTRDEFATALNTFLISLESYLKKQQVVPEDVSTIERLKAEFATELAILNRRTNSLITSTATLEDRQFSPTATLTGEAILAISDEFGEQAQDNLTFQQRIQLSVRTSFTGEDRLRLTLRGGNFEQFSYVEKLTYEGRLGFETDTNNRIELSNISYQFPIGDRLDVFIAPQGDDVDDTNPYFGDRGTGSISRFGRQNPIYRLVESGGIGLEYDISDNLSLSLGYYNQEAESSQPGDGLFNGNYSTSAKLEFEPTKQLQLGLLYVHSYNESNLGTGTGSVRSQLDLERPVVGNSYSLEASWRVSKNFALGGWVGFTDAKVIDLGEADVWNYAFTIAFLDLGKNGNMLGIIVGQEPKLTSTRGFLIDGRSNDPDTSLHLETFYRHQIRNNLSITPGLIWITAPDHNSDNSDLVVLTVRTTFEF